MVSCVRAACNAPSSNCNDHHGGAPYENLFTNIHVGKGTRIWHCGGGRGVGKSCGARETFWNIRGERPAGYPKNFGPQTVNIVGLKTTKPNKTKPQGIWFKTIAPEKLEPPNLFEAQFQRRKATNVARFPQNPL